MTPPVAICHCVTSRFPGMVLLQSHQLPPRLDKEKRQAVFLAVSPTPWTPDNCTCRFGVIHVEEPLNAVGIEHGGNRHGLSTVHMLHRQSERDAIEAYQELVSGKAIEDWAREHRDEET